MYRKQDGFTLTELVIVVAIVMILASVLLPAFVSVRRYARRTTSISNLRQCGVALLMYCDDYGGYQAMPSGDVASQVLKAAPTCDPNDTWRKSCFEEFGSPLVGSYAYIRHVQSFSTQEDWADYISWKKNPTLLASIYYASTVPAPFHGDGPDPAQCISEQKNCFMPDRVLRLRLDGSVRMMRQKTTIPGGQLYLTWSSLFFDDGS